MIKVLIAEDVAPIMRHYQSILSGNQDMDVVGAAQSGKEAAELAQSSHPDVVLMDIEMETKTAGLDATKAILSSCPKTKIVILTVYEDDETVFTAFQLGVSDYILKDANPAEIAACVRDAFHNRSPIRPVIAQKIRQEFKRIKNNEGALFNSLNAMARLTHTETDVLKLLNLGYTRAEICRLRCVELSTVKSQINSILKKFGRASISKLLA
ncbi:MAG: response regulator transcription factor, partial [Clostridiales bacterium]|nr:response regulator transcription factor [Clostridiales bacterium]